MIPPQEESIWINWLVLIGVLIAFIIFFIPCALWELYKHLKLRRLKNGKGIFK